MGQLSIGCDMDGVVYSFVDSVRDYLVNVEGYSDPAVYRGGHLDPDTSWNWFKDLWGMSTEEFLGICDRGVDAGHIFRLGTPYKGTIECLRQIREDGHLLHLITDRSYGTLSRHNTLDWLADWGIEYDSIAFTPHKHLFRPDLMIDDRVENQTAYLDVGVECYLLDRPWNRGLGDPAYRVKSWDDFYGVVCAGGVGV